MALFRKTTADPISQRSQALARQIAELEAQINKLSAAAQREHSAAAAPRVGDSQPHPERVKQSAPATPTRSHPVFVPLPQPPAKLPPAQETLTGDHFNELGMRKFDLLAAWQRLRHHLYGPPATNPKFVNFLAAGSIQGLRPLRYEKRVARNRFLALFALLVAILYGLIYFFVRLK